MVDGRGEDVFCPTRFVVNATENSKKGGVAAEVYSPQTRLFIILTFMHVCIRTYYFVCTRPNILGEKQKRNNPLRSGLGMDM